ncbi:hypothetical protein CEP51_002266 [Fusarium floridanum]|uniref:Uncharacterized protein n=1 Tax=Fusarium floridanum TaxID=1325733 RepID=A0A428SC95_9HYPO|nr:hypothetical protein CEP51_002266 [Fusarium floridanum]
MKGYLSTSSRLELLQIIIPLSYSLSAASTLIFMLSRRTSTDHPTRLYPQPVQRFERDGVYPMSILCALCEGFHRPRLVNEWDAEEATRACVRSGDSEMYEKTMCETFPVYVHFDLVAAITRSWRHNLDFYNPQLLESSITFSSPRAKGSINCRMEAKVIDGRLMLKTERVLFAGYRRAEALKGLPDLVRLLEIDNDLDALSCYTDMTMGYAYIESDDVKLVTLTTWKDLGRGMSIEDPVWKSHNEVPPSTPRNLDLEASSLFHLFEGEGGKKAPVSYLPKLGREVLLDLRNGSIDWL